MGFYSSHMWANGAIITAERYSDDEISIRVQDEKENMLADIVMGEFEAMCFIHAMMSVLTKADDQAFETARLRKKRDED